MSNDSLGDRFKAYEKCWDLTVPRRLPLIIRVDGRAFHSLKLEKPFDTDFFNTMCSVAVYLCQEIQGSVFAYLQSDEISVVARDDVRLNSEPWVGKRLSKINSLSAALATSMFNHRADGLASRYGIRHFDSRAFCVPDLIEVINYMVWRQQDATRNSISMMAHAKFSHKSLQGVSSNGMLDRLREAGEPWEEIKTHFKRGVICRPVSYRGSFEGKIVERWKWEIDMETPIFTAERDYLENLYKLPEKILDND